MIGCFPDPYPDELLYSVGARFNDRMHFPRVSTAIERLFGNEHIAAAVDLPNRIDFLIGSLPPGHQYSAEGLIDWNTLFPFYSPFLPFDRVRRLRGFMRGDSDNHIRGSLAIHSNRVGLPAWLRFCPICVEDDRSSFGETYWHRVHQLTGIDVCPHHSVFLEQSNTRWRTGYGQFVSSEQSITTLAPRPLNLSNTEHALLLKLAREAEWLLGWRGDNLDLPVLYSRYNNLMLERDYAIYNGKVRLSRLLDDFENFYSPGLLTRLNCSVSNRLCCWLQRMCKKSRTLIVQHPLRHLLLISFLGSTVKQVFTSFEEYKPFGSGPWPCFNKASDHYGQPHVTECRTIPNSTRGKCGRPVGVFRCACGFTYMMPEPETRKLNDYKLSSVQDYGHVWETRLRKLWANKDVKTWQIAQELGVTYTTAIQHALRLGLNYPRECTRKRASKSQGNFYKANRPQVKDVVESRRREWLTILEANPEASRHELSEIAGSLHRWLRRYDIAWLESHRPLPSPSRCGRSTRVNWEKEDRRVSRAVMKVAERIRSMPGRPMRVYKTAIVKETVPRFWLERYIGKLPLTAQALQRNTESREDFVMRQIRWAEDYFSKEGICPKRYVFERKANTQNNTGRTPAIQSMVDSALTRLEERFGSGKTQNFIEVVSKIA